MERSHDGKVTCCDVGDGPSLSVSAAVHNFGDGAADGSASFSAMARPPAAALARPLPPCPATAATLPPRPLHPTRPPPHPWIREWAGAGVGVSSSPSSSFLLSPGQEEAAAARARREAAS